MPQVLLVPVDPTEPIDIIDLGQDLDGIADLLDGHPTRAKYDHDSCVLVADDGLMRNMPLNERATEYMREHSYVAKQGRFKGVDPNYVLVGPAIFIGEEGRDDSAVFTDVPQRLVDHFESLERDTGLEL